MSQEPEARTERATAALTPAEKAALKDVAAYRAGRGMDRSTESDLLREWTVEQIVAYADGLRALGHIREPEPEESEVGEAQP